MTVVFVFYEPIVNHRIARGSIFLFSAEHISNRVPKEGKGKERIVTPNGETVSAEIVQPGTVSYTHLAGNSF